MCQNAGVLEWLLKLQSKILFDHQNFEYNRVLEKCDLTRENKLLELSQPFITQNTDLFYSNVLQT